MRRILLLGVITFLLFLLEYIFSQMFGRWFKPNFLLLLVIFTNVFLRTKYSLFVAIFAGILKDSFNTSNFGIYTFSFVFCTYVTTAIRKYFYQVETGYLRVIVAAILSFASASFIYFFILMENAISVSEAMFFTILPEFAATSLLAAYTFDGLKKCVLKLSV